MKPDRFREECGVIGIAGHAEAANLAYLGEFTNHIPTVCLRSFAVEAKLGINRIPFSLLAG